MDEKPQQTEHQDSGPKAPAWRKLVLPTLLTVAIGCIGATPFRFPDGKWITIHSEPLQLDSKNYHVFDNQDGSVAKLGVSPYYFLSYNSPDGHEHWIPLANKRGSTAIGPRLPTIDQTKRSVRYVVILKDHRKIAFDESRSKIIEGVAAPDGKLAVRFKALSVPREGVTPDFHPSEVSSIELQTRPRR